jgi:hypothetical protein
MMLHVFKSLKKNLQIGDSKGKSPMLAAVIANAMVASGAERAFPTIVRRSTVEKSKKRCTMRYHGSESKRHDDANFTSHNHQQMDRPDTPNADSQSIADRT